MALGNREAIGLFFERDGAYRFHALRRQTGAGELRRNRHGEATGVRGGQQFFRIGARPFFKPRLETVGRLRKHPARRGDVSLTGLQVAAPLRGSVTFHHFSPMLVSAAYLDTTTGSWLGILVLGGYPGKHGMPPMAVRNIEEQLG